MTKIKFWNVIKIEACHYQAKIDKDGKREARIAAGEIHIKNYI